MTAFQCAVVKTFHIKRVTNGTSKNVGFGKFEVRYRKRFDGSRRLVFFFKFLLLGALNVFADAPLAVSDLSFYLSIWSSGVIFLGFMGAAYRTELVD